MPPPISTLSISGDPFFTIPTVEQRADHWETSPGATLQLWEGRIAVGDRAKLLPSADSTRNLWAAADLVDTINGRLKFEGSPIRLGKISGSALTGYYPHWADAEPPHPTGDPTAQHTIVRVAAHHKDDKSGSALELPDDCGKAACTVMGATSAEYCGVVLRSGVVIRPMERGSPQETAGRVLLNLLMPEKSAVFFDAPWPEKKPIYQAAIVKYFSMAPVDRRAFDEEHGFNEYARPSAPGDAFTIVNLHDPMFGHPQGDFSIKWPHHWGAVLYAAPERSCWLTLENTIGSSKRSWYFALYGNIGLEKFALRGSGRKTFHAVWREHTFDSHPFTFVARKIE